MTDQHASHSTDAPPAGTPSEAADRELAEARLTAYAIGQFDDTEAADVERLLADPDRAEARRQVAEIRRLAAVIRSAPDETDSATSAELRRMVLATLTAPSPPVVVQTATHRSRTRSRWHGWRSLAFLGSLAAALLVTATLYLGTPAPEVAMVRGRVMPPQPTSVGVAVQKEPERPSFFPPPAVAPPPAHRPKRMLPPPGPSTDRSRREQAVPQIARAAPAADMAFQGHGEITDRRAGGEGYATIVENRFLSPREQPLSTFSIDVDTASYANVRRFLSAGRRPPRDAVRIEELVNYFRFDYPQPEADVPFSVTVDAAECPWTPGHRLVRIGLQGRDIDRRERPAGNLVFLVDTSGSMQALNKLPLVKQALAMLVGELTENDRVAIVTYAGNAGLALPPTTGDRKHEIRAAIDALEAGGATHGSAGIAAAYEQAGEHFIPGGSNRVILATDGDLNVGVTSTSALVELIREKARAGVFLTVLGFGEGNLQDEKMEALADNGNGVYAYIDGVREARKVLVEQLMGSTTTIAKDVKIQVEFNPAQVTSYRLIGYENRALATRHFRDDTKDAGEIGAGHSVTAIYEVVLAGEEVDAPVVEPLKYQPRIAAQAGDREPARAVDRDVNRELLTVKLRWKQPDADTSTGLERPLTDRGPAFEQAPADLRFAAAVAAFGMILRGSDQRGQATLPLVAKVAAGALGRDEGGYRAEFLDLVRRASQFDDQPARRAAANRAVRDHDDVQADPAQPPSDRLARALAATSSLSFSRDTLERAMHMIAAEIGVPIEILSRDLQLEGITQNQSFGLDERNKTAETILRTILMKANPDGKLVYVIRVRDGVESIAITTRAACRRRGETIPDAFREQP